MLRAVWNGCRSQRYLIVHVRTELPLRVLAIEVGRSDRAHELDNLGVVWEPDKGLTKHEMRVRFHMPPAAHGNNGHRKSDVGTYFAAANPSGQIDSSIFLGVQAVALCMLPRPRPRPRPLYPPRSYPRAPVGLSPAVG